MKHTHRLTGWHAQTVSIRKPQNHKPEHCITTCQHSHNQQYNKSCPKTTKSTQNETTSGGFWPLAGPWRPRWALPTAAGSLSVAYGSCQPHSDLKSAWRWPCLPPASRDLRWCWAHAWSLQTSAAAPAHTTIKLRCSLEKHVVRFFFYWERKCVISEHHLLTKATDNLQKPRGLHLVSAYGHGPVHIGPGQRV